MFGALFLAAAVALPVPSPSPGVPQTVTLQQAIDIAAAKSPVLAAARANRDLTQIPVDLARTAILPNISGTASTTRSLGGRGSNGSRNSNAPVGSGGFTSDSFGVTLRQLIFDGGKTIAQLHQAQANAVAGLNTYQRALETLSFNVAQAYFNVLSANSTVQVDREILKEAQTNENLTQAQVRTGAAPRVDAVTAHVPTVQAQVQLTRDQGALASALGAFANEMGLDPTTLVQPAPVATNNPSQLLVTALPYAQAVTRALALRPDYLSAQEAVTAAQYNVQAQRAGLYPTINGTASASSDSTLPNGSGFVGSSSIGASLTLPIFDQGITRAQVRQAQAQLALAQASSDETKLGVELNVQQALVGLASDRAAVVQAQAALSAAQESLRGAQAQFKAGVNTLVNLIQAQTNYTQAQTTLVNAVYTLRQAEQTYIFALGESSINPVSS